MGKYYFESKPLERITKQMIEVKVNINGQAIIIIAIQDIKDDVNKNENKRYLLVSKDVIFY